jgi:hypothetical protein
MLKKGGDPPHRIAGRAKISVEAGIPNSDHRPHAWPRIAAFLLESGSCNDAKE